MGESTRLVQAENQTEDLECDNQRVHDPMMNIAGSVGEQGFKLQGMYANEHDYHSP